MNIVRFREALLEATPYCLRLRNHYQCRRVLDLVKFNLPDLEMPPVLQAQVGIIHCCFFHSRSLGVYGLDGLGGGGARR